MSYRRYRKARSIRSAEESTRRNFLSDIRLKNDHLITDGTLAQGILVALGDVALETVSLE
jgi:hypothetical protein